MTANHGDAGCVAALTEAIGHPPPFGADELARIESLTVVHARNLDPLVGCTGLRTLRIIGAEIDSSQRSEQFAALTKLEHVELIASRLDSTTFLLDCDSLNRKDLLFIAYPDLAVAASEVLGAGGSGTILGVPFDADIGEYLSAVGELRSEYERTQCARLFERTGAVFGLIGGRCGVLVRPGLPVMTGNIFDALHLSTAELEEALDDPDFSLNNLFERFEEFVPDPSELLTQPTARPVETIRRWLVDVEFSAEDRLGVDRFMQRYPEVPLRADSLEVLDQLERAYAELVPTRYALRMKLAGWLLLRGCPPLLLDGGETWAVGIDDAEPDPHDLLLRAGYLAIGRAIGRPDRVLLFELGDRGRVVAANEEAVLDALAQRRDPAAELAVLFYSLSELLDAVGSIHPEQAASTQPAREVESSWLHRHVRRELRRLNGRAAYDPATDSRTVRTPTGVHRIPPAIQELLTVTWPTGYSIRTDFGWRVRLVQAPIEVGLFLELRAWFGIAADDGRHIWIIDLADEHPEDPMVYRVDHEGQDHSPYGEKLSIRLAGCVLTKTPTEALHL